MLDIILTSDDDQPTVKLTFEHSLLSISKWESLYEKPFYGKEPKTDGEASAYIRCMLLTEDPPVNFLDRLDPKNFKTISEYLESKYSATTFGMEPEQKSSNEVITSELIYFWLVQFQIPFHPTETWHINRLMNLVRIAGIKNSKPKKMNKRQIAEQYRTMNDQRRRELGSAG